MTRDEWERKSYDLADAVRQIRGGGCAGERRSDVAAVSHRGPLVKE